MKKIKIKIRSEIIGYIIGSIVAASLFLSGCGKKEETAEAPVIEQLDEDGNVIGTSGGTDEETSDETDAETSDETETDTSDATGAEASDTTDTEASDATDTETSDATDADTSDETDADTSDENDTEDSDTTDADTTDATEAYTFVDKDYLKDMSDDDIKALAEEALSNAGKSTEIVTGKTKTYGINYDLPEGFEADQQTKNLFVTDRYPIDASNVQYIELDPDYTLQLMTKDSFKQLLEDAYLENYSQTVSVNIEEFKETKISGIPAFRIKADYDLNDIHLEHLIIIVNGSKTYILDYTQTDEYDRMDLFEASAATISVKK